MKITGSLRPGSEFEITTPATQKAKVPYLIITDTEIVATHYLNEVYNYPGDTQVIAFWPGQWRTDGFITTVSELAKGDSK